MEMNNEMVKLMEKLEKSNRQQVAFARVITDYATMW